MKNNLFTWVEIPVTDMDRAMVFYQSVFDIELQFMDFGGVQMAWFPHDPEATGATGTLIKHDTYVPSHEGPLVYLSCEDVQHELDIVISAGGKVYQEKTQISPEHGFMAVFIDSEGNRVALHSQK